MSISGEVPVATPDIEVEARFHELRDYVGRMACFGPDGQLLVPDIYHKAFFESLSYHLGNPDFPVFNQLVRADLAAHPRRLPVNTGNLYLRDNQDFVLGTERPFSTHPYPYGYGNPQAWSARYVTLEVSPTAQEHFRINTKMNVRTTIPDRGLLVKASALLLGMDEPLRMLDVGCSRNHVAKKLAYPRRRHFPYGDVRIVEPAEETVEAVVNRGASQVFNSLLNADNLAVRQIIGIDIQDPLIGQKSPMAEKMRLWDRHCFYPSEYRGNSERIFDFDLLEAMDLEEVGFYLADVTDPDFDQDAFANVAGNQPKADVAYFSTVAHQLGQQGTDTAIANIRQQLKPDGVIMITEFLDSMTPDGKMEFSPTREPFTYRHYVLDLAREEDGWQELFAAETGRVRRVMLTLRAAELAADRGIDLRLTD